MRIVEEDSKRVLQGIVSEGQRGRIQGTGGTQERGAVWLPPVQQEGRRK